MLQADRFFGCRAAQGLKVGAPVHARIREGCLGQVPQGLPFSRHRHLQAHRGFSQSSWELARIPTGLGGTDQGPHSLQIGVGLSGYRSCCGFVQPPGALPGTRTIDLVAGHSIKYCVGRYRVGKVGGMFC
jgi:hypothetical protein